MSITDQVPHELSSSIFDAIEKAFDAVWSTLHVHAQFGSEQSQELKIALRQTLVALVSDGVNDPEELRRRALEHLQAQRPESGK
jgi:hypothetical protein